MLAEVGAGRLGGALCPVVTAAQSALAEGKGPLHTSHKISTAWRMSSLVIFTRTVRTKAGVEGDRSRKGCPG